MTNISFFIFKPNISEIAFTMNIFAIFIQDMCSKGAAIEFLCESGINLSMPPTCPNYGEDVNENRNPSFFLNLNNVDIILAQMPQILEIITDSRISMSILW